MDYNDYINRLLGSGNTTAMHVKIADLTHNSDIFRFKEKAFLPENLERAKKYQKYKAIIEEYCNRNS